MTEAEARAWLADRYPVALIGKLERFVAMLAEEAGQQSLIARSTLDAIWSRHIVDSAQLIELAPASGDWLDVGSGGGLPGIVVAILRDSPITLSEPRRKRAEFLRAVVEQLGLARVRISDVRVQQARGEFAVVSARAVAPVVDIFAWTACLVSRETRYVLQRGKSWQDELAHARKAWHGTFHVEQSATDPLSGILIAHCVRPR